MVNIKIAFLGFGYQAAIHHAEYLHKRRDKDVQICGVFDILPEHGKICVKKLDRIGLRLSPILTMGPEESSPDNDSGVNQLLHASITPDAVVISTPHAKHYAQIKACLEHGMHVLVDKPLATTVDEARKLVDLAKKKQRALVVSSQRRYEPTYLHLKKLIDDRSIGDIVSVNATLSQSQHLDPMSWRANPTLSHGGSAGDHGWHTIDYLCHLFGHDIASVYATLWTPPDLRVETSGMVHIRWHSGVSANLAINHLAPKNSVYEGMLIWGTEGIITVNRYKQYKDALQPTITLQRRDGGVYLQPDFSGEPAQRWAPTKAFVDYLVAQRNGSVLPDATEVRSWGSDSLGAVAAIEAMYISAKTSISVQLQRSIILKKEEY